MNLVYLCFGKENLRFECELVYSLLSFSKVSEKKVRDATTITIYTDHDLSLPKDLVTLKIVVKHLDKELIRQWIFQSNGYPYVLKTRVVHDFLKTNKSTALFIDSDTYFLSDPSQLFNKADNGNIVMHLRERPVSKIEPVWTFFRNNAVQKINNKKFYVDDFNIWNSGIIGVSPRHIDLIEEVIFLIEQISGNKAWPVEYHTLEQIALSYVFSEVGILAADAVIIHYWFSKTFRLVLAKHFNYFQRDDKALTQALVTSDISKVIPDAMRYEDLPYVMKKLLMTYPPGSPADIYAPYCSMEVILDDLPADTFIGRFLRER